MVRSPAKCLATHYPCVFCYVSMSEGQKYCVKHKYKLCKFSVTHCVSVANISDVFHINIRS